MGLVVEVEGTEENIIDHQVALAATTLETARPAASRAATIRRRVAERTSGQIRDLSVAAVEGRGIVLSGRAATFYSKQLAQHAAMQVARNLPLVNEIEVA